MFQNYFRFAWRNLIKNKALTAINILGLAIGISASLVIFLIAGHHFSFDKFEKGGDRIYRVVSDFAFSTGTYHSAGVLSPMGPAMKKELTGLDAVVPFRLWDQDAKITIPAGTGGTGAPGTGGAPGLEPVVYTHTKNIVFAGEPYFNLVGYQWIAGSPATSLRQPYQMVLSESAARLYFPLLSAGQVLGKEILFNDSVRTTITGIVKDLPDRSDLTFKVFISLMTLENTTLRPDDWADWSSTDPASQLLVKLSPGTKPALIEKEIYRLYEKFRTGDQGSFKGQWSYTLQPLSDLHFNSTYAAYGRPVANRPTLYGLVAVGCFLLLLACINFINLTTAHAARRAKEIGVRKTMGSSRRQLMGQFLGETVLVTALSAVLAVGLTPVIVRAFAVFIPEGLSFSAVLQPRALLLLLLLVLVVASVAGFYPALVLSGYNPVLVLKNQAYADTGQSRNAWLRKTLTTSQFVIAQFFIIAVLLVSKQIHYSLNKDMGFKKEALLYFEVNPRTTTPGRQSVLMARLKDIPEITMVSQSNKTPSSDKNLVTTFIYRDGKTATETQVYLKLADTGYMELYHLRLLAGRNLTHSDTVQDLVINETYARMLGFTNPRQALGKYIDWQKRHLPVVGVVADFNQRSLHEVIKPLAIASQASQEITFNIGLRPQASEANWSAAISKMASLYKNIYPGEDFDYHFFDKDIAQYYEKEQRVDDLLKWATGLTIFISCLGLLGLVMYTTTQRTKEIGVRKVLGASVMQIVTLISKEFLSLVLIAFVIAAPVAWWGAHAWLQNFAFRTEVSWWVFAASGLLMLAIALLTLAFQTVKAATANPVASLRSE